MENIEISKVALSVKNCKDGVLTLAVGLVKKDEMAPKPARTASHMLLLLVARVSSFTLSVSIVTFCVYFS